MSGRIPRSTATAAATAMLVLGCQGNTDAPDAPSQPAPPTGDAQVTVPTSTAAPGSQIDVRASGFAPNTSVQLGLGHPQSEYSVVTEARTDAQGRLETQLTLPSWPERGEEYVLVVAEPDHDPRAVSEPFIVAAPGDTVRVHGTLTNEGVECRALRSPTGALYTLAATDTEYAEGTQVMVEGTIPEVSTCMQGTTIRVTSIQRH